MEGRRWSQSRAPRSPQPPKLTPRAESLLEASSGSEVGFTVSVLAEKTGTPVPTIHHYRHLGLLPEATELASNRFLYDERHVEALIVIRLLRERRNLPLETDP